MSTTADNTTIVGQCFAAAQRGDRAALEQILSPDFVIHVPEDHHGAAGLLEMVGSFRAALPDLSVAVEQQFAAGDYVTSRFTVHGTHDGELFGVPPSGRAVTMSGITISRCESGRIAEEWELVDVAGLLVQIGALPEPAAAG